MKIFTSSRIARLLLALALLPAAAMAGITQIAQVPLLNLAGTGAVKPNLMLLFDNSGSMDQTYTPDYVDDSICRTRLTLALGSLTGCKVGMPPFMSPDFNRQFYNPRIHYTPPIKSDGTFYAEMNSGQTNGWTEVPSDGFGKQNVNLSGTADTTIDLLTEFPDLKWCNASDSNDCRINTATYSYPDNTYTASAAIKTSPYYFNIAVAEYCKDETMKVCTPVSPGAAAPSGFPVAAKVRWCDSRALTNCQAKQVGLFKYPRYSQPTSANVVFGTISINASVSTSSMQITEVRVQDPNGPTPLISNGAVTAANGTKTAANQAALANALAKSIIDLGKNAAATTGYVACVRNSALSGVPSCSQYSIPLSSDNVVAVIPVQCTGTKTIDNCTPYSDASDPASRAGWGILLTRPEVQTTKATSGYPPTALITFGDKTANSGTPKLANLKFGSTTLFSTVNLGNNKTSSNVASTVRTTINNANVTNIRAYIGGDAVTPVCAAQSASTVCVISSASNAADGVALTGTLSNSGNLTMVFAASASMKEALPATATAISTTQTGATAFIRVNLLPGQTYPRANNRADCVAQAGVCTYEEEMTNFANWYAYYKSRLQMMKTSVGIAFAAITSDYRVGYVRLSQAGAGSTIDLKPAEFSGTARASWYTTLYNTTTSGSTPIRTAMDNVGRMFANLSPYNYAAGQQVIQYPCQQNFLILTTDGYWNGSSTANVTSNDETDQPSRFCLASRGCVDPNDQSQPSISDVALHWYNGGSSDATVSLRPDLEPDMSKPGQVPAGDGDNTHLHMNTYTLGLGMDGVMTYEKNYDTAPKVGGDFYNLITGVTNGCPWNGGGAYTWPDPKVTDTGNTVQERVDDLWHAAINGHGKYFSANEPKEVVEGLSDALANMQVTLGAASSAATSTPNISQQDNDIFSDTFTTVKWYGELNKRKIDITNGNVSLTPDWTTNDTLGHQVDASSDDRTILMWNPAGSSGSTPANFRFGAMTVEKPWFSDKCALLSQCTLLSAADRLIVNNGENMVNWLRGQQQYANDTIFRAYSPSPTSPSIPVVLGDIASSRPAYVRDPRKDYTLNGYQAWKTTTTKARTFATVFTAANDGMLHAFNADDGQELWAYVPRVTMNKLYKLSSTTYATNHQFTTDGAPEVADVYFGGAWHTVLVAGYNGGGRGYYALDITDPANPRQLWEICADAAVCSNVQPNLGLTFGNPQFGMLADGTWAVFLTSGYNNVPGTDNVNTGDGRGRLYVINVQTGALLQEIQTDTTDNTGTPSGLAKITAITEDPQTDPRITYIYGGDNQGRLFRFDFTGSGGGTVMKLGDAGPLQPITTRPDVTLCAIEGTDGSKTAQRVVLFGTGRLLDVPDTTNTDVQSLYLLKDEGALVALRGGAMEKQTLVKTSGGNTNVYEITEAKADLRVKAGWYFDWALNAGERMNIDPRIVSGVANVVTNMPTSSSSCSVGGTSNAYAVDVCNGSGVNSTIVAGTLSNTSAAVGFIIIRLPNGQLKMITTTAKGETLTRPITELDSEGAHPVGWRRVKGD
jgi:type IV pilus assembly protein PilY1